MPFLLSFTFIGMDKWTSSACHLWKQWHCSVQVSWDCISKILWLYAISAKHFILCLRWRMNQPNIVPLSKQYDMFCTERWAHVTIFCNSIYYERRMIYWLSVCHILWTCIKKSRQAKIIFHWSIANPQIYFRLSWT